MLEPGVGIPCWRGRNQESWAWMGSMRENGVPGIPNGNSAPAAHPQAWEKHLDPAASLRIFHGCSFPAAPPGVSRQIRNFPRSQIQVGHGHVLALPIPCLVPHGHPAFPCRSFPKVIPAPPEAEKWELSGTRLIQGSPAVFRSSLRSCGFMGSSELINIPKTRIWHRVGFEAMGDPSSIPEGPCFPGGS